jgi:hypothetical protein
MDVSEQLDNLRNAFPECELMALADISAGLVLCASSGETRPREQLDAICAQARSLLDGAAAKDCLAAVRDEGAPAPQQALSLSDGRLSLFLRSPHIPTDVLCCICRPDVDIATMAERGRAYLIDIGAE